MNQLKLFKSQLEIKFYHSICWRQLHFSLKKIKVKMKEETKSQIFFLLM